MRKRRVAEEDTALTPQQLAQLRQLLEAEQRRILANAEKGLEYAMSRGVRDSGQDSLDESLDEALLSTELRLRDREKKLLDKVRKALDRLEDGTINECEDCGGPIGFKRLLARPVTTLCITCKEAREAEERLSEQAGRSTDGLGLGLTGPGDEL